MKELTDRELLSVLGGDGGETPEDPGTDAMGAHSFHEIVSGA